MVDLESRLNHVSAALDDIKESQKCLTRRLENIERDINKVEGAWWIARYVIGPLIILLPTSAWLLYEWFNKHVK